MNQPNTLRSGTLWIGGVVALIAVALAVGYFTPPSEPKAALPEVDEKTSQQPAPEPTGPWATATLHSYPLSTADIRDTQEAPVVAVDAQQRIYLAWASQTGSGERTLFFTSSNDRGKTFAAPRALRKSGIFKAVSPMNGKTVARERRMLPHLAAYGDKVLIAWGEAPTDGQSIRYLVAESMDGGVTFSEPIAVHEGEDARPTFTDFSVSPHGQIAASWLDSRNRAQQPFAAVRFAGSEQFSTEQMIFPGQDNKGVCPCCTTAVKVADDETVVVAYRGQVDGFRDIWVSVKRPSDTQFSTPVAVMEPTWKFEGCPHDGPSLAIKGDMLHVAWMDARSGKQRVYHGLANLHELKFTTHELNARGPGTQSNARLWVDARGALHAVWEESLAEEELTEPGEKSRHEHAPPTGAGRVIMHSSSPLANEAFEIPHAIRAMPGKFQTRPGIACDSTGLLVAAWNELDESGKRLVIAVREDK